MELTKEEKELLIKTIQSEIEVNNVFIKAEPEHGFIAENKILEAILIKLNQ